MPHPPPVSTMMRALFQASMKRFPASAHRIAASRFASGWLEPARWFLKGAWRFLALAVAVLGAECRLIRLGSALIGLAGA